MAKIYWIKAKPAEFQEVPVGEGFVHDEGLYIRIRDAKGVTNAQLPENYDTAINVSTGHIELFHNKVKVGPVDVMVRAKEIEESEV